MPYLRNPGGRIVAVDDLNQYQKYLTEPGWEKVSTSEEKAFIRDRYALVQSMKSKELDPGKIKLYMATVTQGGKDGYGVSSNHLIDRLREMDVIVNTFQNDQKIGLLFHNPYSILRMDNAFRLIYTMFESTKIPDEWVEYLIEADEVLVPSKWCKGVFAKAGIKTTVVPLGYDEDTYKPIKRKPKHKTKQPFTFLHYNAFNARKGFLELFKAFTQEFDPAEPVRLILKTNLQAIPGSFPVNPRQYPNIEIITESYGDKEMQDLMARSDCFVFPSRGEGFGITPLEAMATAMPTIVPNAHGITEYFDRRYMYEVKVKGECPALYTRYKGEDVGKMVECDVKHLQAQMRYVYEHQEEAIKKGKLASKYVKRYTFTKSAEKLKSILDDYYIKTPREREIKNAISLEEI